MQQIIGNCVLGKAQLEISAEELELDSGPYRLTFTLPESSVVVAGVSKEDLLGLGQLSLRVHKGEAPVERWDGQSGG